MSDHSQPTGTPLRLTSTLSDTAVVIVAVGEIDLATSGRVADAVKTAHADRVPAVVLDLAGVTFMDSTGVRTLLELTAQSANDGRRLSIVPSGAVDRVIDLCGVRGRLPLACAGHGPSFQGGCRRL